MKKANKKTILIIGLIIIAVLCALIYMRPMTLSDNIAHNSTLLFAKIDLGVEDGRPYNESTNYNDITEQQKQEILMLLGNFPYTRNVKTLFSDGSMANNDGDGYFYIYIYSETDYVGTVIMAYDDEISIGNKNYTMQNSSDLINQILDIING